MDVHIRRLRKSLEASGYDRFVQTVRGAGYRFSAQPGLIHVAGLVVRAGPAGGGGCRRRAARPHHGPHGALAHDRAGRHPRLAVRQPVPPAALAAPPRARGPAGHRRRLGRRHRHHQPHLPPQAVPQAPRDASSSASSGACRPRCPTASCCCRRAGRSAGSTARPRNFWACAARSISASRSRTWSATRSSPPTSQSRVGQRRRRSTCRACEAWLALFVIPAGEQFLMLVRDVTREVRLEQMRKDFVANASHELRSPLTVISGYLDELADGGGHRRGMARARRRHAPPGAAHARDRGGPARALAPGGDGRRGADGAGGHARAARAAGAGSACGIRRGTAKFELDVDAGLPAARRRDPSSIRSPRT